MRILNSLILSFVLVLLSCATSRQQAEIISEDNLSANSAPVIIKSVTPDYPVKAWDEGITGTVWLKIHIDTLGVVSDAAILSDSGYNVSVFRVSALEAALKTKWKPARENGNPIPVWVTYKVDFNIK